MLQDLLRDMNKRDVTFLMGDLNAKVGEDNTGYEQVMGRRGLGVMNENGELLADLCAANSFTIGWSIFPHKSVHKVTWVSLDGITVNQIDHICINQKFRRSLCDVRVRRGADAASDHHLLTASVKLKLRRFHRPRNSRTRFNVHLLKDPLATKEFSIKLSNRFQALQDLNGATPEKKNALL